MAIEIVSFPINSMVDLSIVMSTFARGYSLSSINHLSIGVPNDLTYTHM